MDELIRAAGDAQRMAEHVDSRRSNRTVNSYENVIRERDLMEWRVRQEYEEQWRTAESLRHRERIFSREESIPGFTRTDKEVSVYEYHPLELSARGRRPRSPAQNHLSRHRDYEPRDIHPRSRDDKYSNSIRRPHLQPVDHTSIRSRRRSSRPQVEFISRSNDYCQPPQTNIQSEPQYVPPPGYNTALAQSQQAIQAFLNDEYDPPPPYHSPERHRQKDKKKSIRAKNHQKALSWLAGRRRLGDNR